MAHERTAAVMLCLLFVSGCAHFHKDNKARYLTIPGAPLRDEHKAKAENAKATRLMKANKIKLAERAINRALIADINYGPAHNNLGKIYFLQGDYYLAAWEFEYAMRLMPNQVEPPYNLGMVYEAAGQLEKAVSYYESAYNMAPRNAEVIGNLARTRLALDESDPFVDKYLSDVVMHDTRQQWKAWARETIARRSSKQFLDPSADGYDLPGTTGSSAESFESLEEELNSELQRLHESATEELPNKPLHRIPSTPQLSSPN